MPETTLSIRDLQLLELDILREVDALCRENGLTYYLGEGSMLGAIRHGGFIPWDDDLDILMPREDYETFLTLRDQLPGTLTVQHHTTTHPYWSPTIKVRLKDNSRFAQQHIARLTAMKTGWSLAWTSTFSRWIQCRRRKVRSKQNRAVPFVSGVRC